VTSQAAFGPPFFVLFWRGAFAQGSATNMDRAVFLDRAGVLIEDRNYLRRLFTDGQAQY